MEPVWGYNRDPQANVANQCEGPAPLGATVGGPYYRRSPLIIQAANGDWLLFTDVHSNTADDYNYGFVMQRSTDAGLTWSAPQTIYTHATYVGGTDWVAAGSVVVDRMNTGAITYLFIQSSTTVHRQYIIRSTDHGATWSAATEITSTVKVTGVNAPAGHTYNGTPWTWCVPAAASGLQLTQGPNAGRLLVPFDHRFVSLATSNPSYSHTIKSDDGGATWSLHGGLSEVTANEFSNECAITETNTPGRLVMHIRRTAGATTRMQSVSTDYGATWSNQAALTNLVGSDTAGDVKKVGSLLVASYSSDPAAAQRVGLSLAISRDDGATWAAADTRLISGRPAGYSSLMVAGNTVAVAFERGQSNRGSSSIPEYSQAIQVLKTNLAWLLSPTTRYSDWFFNEESTPFTTARTLGGEIPDYGNLDERAVCQTLAAPPTYQATGIYLTSAADHIILSPATDPAFDTYATQSLSIEVEATIGPAQNGAIISKMIGTNGYQLEVLSNVLKLTYGDGTNTITITGATTVNDGVRRCYAFVRDKTRGKLGIYINGVLDAAEATDTTGAVAQTGSGLLLGMKTGGTLQLDMVVHSARATRGVARSFISVNREKSIESDLRHYTLPTIAAGPASISGLQLWTHQTSDLGTNAFADINLTERYIVPPPIGAGIRSLKDASSGRRHYRTSEFRRWVYASDAKMGPCWFSDWLTGAPGYMQDTAAYGATNGFDFIQNLCVFSISGCVNFKATTSNIQSIAGSNQATGGNAGFLIWRADGASGKLNFLVTTGPGGGSVNRFNEQIATAPALSYGSSYFFCFVGRGIGSKVDLYLAPLTADYSASAAAPTVTKYQSSANMAAVAGAPFTTLSTDVLSIGACTASLYGMNGYLKNFLIYNTSLTDADVQALATFNARY